MKVLFLGAGASIDAGYPSTSTLLDEIEKEISHGADVATRKAWNHFVSFRKGATGPLAHILNSPNPEVVLSYPDLLVAALGAHDAEIDRKLKQAYAQYDQQAVETIVQEFDEPARNILREGLSARHDLLSCLHYFLGVRHTSDAGPDAFTRRASLRRELTWLSSGDSIVTTNWDTLAERILTEQLLWSPLDGYGFSRNIVPKNGTDILPAWFPRSSAIRVLKLHGSFGWYILATNKRGEQGALDIFLDSREFLAFFPYRYKDSVLYIRDASEPEFHQPDNTPFLIYPSFLKQLVGCGIQTVWEAARCALEAASEVRIVGASLPDSDTALRTLLNPLRFHAEHGTVSIAVHNPDTDAHTRWQEFLGERIVCRRLRTGEANSSGS